MTRSAKTRTARCVCGRLSAAVEGEPSGIYACSCLDCQRGSGSAFSYAAIYPRSAMTVSGQHTAYRSMGNAGRWTEGHFCPVCGANVFSYAQAQPDEVIVAAGCFADSSLPPPSLLFWASRRHHWLKLPDATKLLDRQPD